MKTCLEIRELIKLPIYKYYSDILRLYRDESIYNIAKKKNQKNLK